MKVRIAKLLKLELREQIDTPLAVLIGKCDAWLHLLGPNALRNPIVNAHLDLDAAKYNSDLIRTLMKRISPSIVANAESISRRVLFFRSVLSATRLSGWGRETTCRTPSN